MSKETFQKLADFILNKSRHQLDCPTYVRKSDNCRCGLDEIRAIARGEA